MLNEKWIKFENTVGGLKFAVVIISFFTLSMIVGTFVESYYGTLFANRLIYKSYFFMFIQVGLFLSIFMAALLRLPPQKRLYGFYTIHSGLLITCAGSFLTFYSGIDGSITLYPQQPARTISLNEDTLLIQYPDKAKKVVFELPKAAFQTTIDKTYKDVKIEEYLPFSETRLEWLPPTNNYHSNQEFHSSQYFLYNDNVSQEIYFTLHPDGLDFPTSVQLGPLTIHYLSGALSRCFKQNIKDKWIIWNQEESDCYFPGERKVDVHSTDKGNKFLVLKHNQELYSFFPDFSPWPISQDFKTDKNSPLRVFSLKLLQKKPQLLIFGKSAAYYSDEKWTLKDIEINKDGTGQIELPWMDFKLKLIRHESKLTPQKVPYYVLPIQNDGALIKGDQKAVKLKIKDKSYWVTDKYPLGINIDGEKVIFNITKAKINLPYEFSLTRFKKDVDPGTTTAASYESFVRVFDENGSSDHHVYMNNPYKRDDLTFYQASFFQVAENVYGSILSVNMDPGRWMKYFGSFLLVFGSMWHYFLNRKKSRKL
jgi:hypothetical protein